jgi:hypothetical protein
MQLQGAWGNVLLWMHLPAGMQQHMPAGMQLHLASWPQPPRPPQGLQGALISCSTAAHGAAPRPEPLNGVRRHWMLGEHLLVFVH